MNKTFLLIPLVAGAIAAAGCGSSGDQSSQAADARGDIEKNLASATTGAASDRRAASATPAIGVGALEVVNKTNQTIQLHVGGVDNFDWANGNRPDHRPPQGIQQAVLGPGYSVLARNLEPNYKAHSHPFNVEFIGTKPRNAVLGAIRLTISTIGAKADNQANGEHVTCVVDFCVNGGSKDYPQAGDYILRIKIPYVPSAVGKSTDPPTEPTVLTITQKSNPTW